MDSRFKSFDTHAIWRCEPWLQNFDPWPPIWSPTPLVSNAPTVFRFHLWTAPSDICQGIYRFPLSFLAAAARCARRLGALLVVGVVRCLLQLEYQSSATGEILRFSFSVLYKTKYSKYYTKLKWILYIFVFGLHWKFLQIFKVSYIEFFFPIFSWTKQIRN